MHNIGKLTYAQRLAIQNGRMTKDIPGLTFNQRLAINKHREREEHSGQESQPSPEAGALLGEEQEGAGVRYVGVDQVSAGEASQDQEAAPEHDVVPPAKKRRTPRKKG